MMILPFLAKSVLLICALAGPLSLGAQSSFGQTAAPQKPGTSAGLRVEDTELRAGPFPIAGQNYSFVLHEKRLADAGDHALAQTLTSVEIRDAAGNVSYQKTFPYEIEDSRFQRSVSASARLASGKTGAGLLVRYREQTATPQTGKPQTSESWQIFGLKNGKLAPLGKPLPLGEGMAGGPYMGVLMRAENGTVSVIKQPDTIELRAWTGNFYVYVPLRVDWNQGGLTQGERCFEMVGGGLREEGCDLRVNADRKPPAEEFTFLRLLQEAQENPGSAQHVVAQKDSKVEILGCRAITTWNENGDRIEPVFSDVWLHVRIDDREGWIHGEEDFSSVGLPAGNPAP